MSHCGHFLINNRDSPLPALSAPLPAKTNAVLLGTPCTHTLYSAYVGNVDLDCATHAKNRVFLQSTVTDQSTGQSIDVRVINAREHKLSDSVTYSTEYLKQLHPMIIDKDENKYYYLVVLLSSNRLAGLQNRKKEEALISQKISSLAPTETLLTRVKSQYPQLFKKTTPVHELKRIYREAVGHNSAVDVLFNLVNYVQFLKREINLWGISHKPFLLAIVNVDNLDNAYWTGEYMVFGNGDTSFYPLTCLDVCGHEIAHGVVSQLSGLKYEKHSGALNESFADIIGTHFEMCMYEKFSSNSDPRDDLLGEGDYLIGEDIDMSGKCLRNMIKPEQGLIPQPCRFKGPHYVNPNLADDNGGVHVNSGIPNHCFYLLAQKIGRAGAFKWFMACLRKLNPKSSFIDFRNVLLQVSENDKSVKQCLDQVGLDCKAVSDVVRNNSRSL